MTMKQCTKCKEWKEVSQFYKLKDGKIYPSCKTCENQRCKKWSQKNHEYDLNRKRKYHAEHKEEERIKRSKCYQENREKKLAETKKWRLSNLEYNRARAKAWNQENHERYLGNVKKWRNEHLEQVRSHCRDRRARTKGSGGNITVQEWQDLKKKYDFTCLRCKRREPEIKLTLDHVMPLSRGGKHVIENAQCLCKSCNSIKAIKNIDYRPVLQRSEE